MTFIHLLIITAITIILILSVIAIRLVYKVHSLNKVRQEKLVAQEKANQESQRNHRQWLNKSIQLLAQGLDNNELSLTEASIRISGLLDVLGADDQIKTEFSAFYQLKDKTQHIPYLEAWKNLSPAEQNKFDLERIQHEAAYQDFVSDAAKRILGREF
jgi:Protein of unknown function (DUF2489)